MKISEFYDMKIKNLMDQGMSHAGAVRAIDMEDDLQEPGERPEPEKVHGFAIGSKVKCQGRIYTVRGKARNTAELEATADNGKTYILHNCFCYQYTEDATP